MDLKTAGALRRLRLVSTPEAISFLLLLVASVLKRTTDLNAVPVLGAVHGGLFVLYLLFLLDAWNRTRWRWQTAAWYLLMAVLPTGGFFAERRLRALERAEGDGARAGGERRTGTPDADAVTS